MRYTNDLTFKDHRGVYNQPGMALTPIQTCMLEQDLNPQSELNSLKIRPQLLVICRFIGLQIIEPDITGSIVSMYHTKPPIDDYIRLLFSFLMLA